jgi:cholest-4-en-3-one 26-monooxygenase
VVARLPLLWSNQN